MQLSPKLIALALLASVTLTSPIWAATTTVTVYADAAPPDLNVVGSSSAAPGFPSGSVQANAPAIPNGKSEVYFGANLLFPTLANVHIGDIKSISYWTNKPGNYGDPDWTFLIYTKPTGTDDTTAKYHTRLNSEPYFTNSTTDAPGTWHQWSTDNTEAMKFYDVKRDGGNYGTYSDPTLATLVQNSTYQWQALGGTSNDYRDEQISAFSLQTGTAWAQGFTGLVDGLTITLNTGEVGIVNFEATAAVPEPASLISMGTAALLGLGYFARRRRSK